MEEIEAYILAGAASYLVEGQELYEASVLLLCDKLRLIVGDAFYSRGAIVSLVDVELFGNRTVYEIINDEELPSTITIRRAIQAALGSGYKLINLSCRAVISDALFESNWRSKLLDVIEGTIPLNQGIPIQDKPRYSWEYLFFRSPVEIAIAKSLDKRGVLFLPNCATRLGLPNGRENKEADFLVCHDGKWGILEINGDAYHTNSAKDHNRSRLFKIHGIRVFEAYEAKRCIKEPDTVVDEFLGLINKNG